MTLGLKPARPARPAGLLPDDAIARRIDSEAVLLFGGGRALLMQLAHPAVAAGVAEHSRFEDDPLRRLRRTLEANHAIVFGSVARARATTAAVRAVHETVVGPGYRANDPDLLLWVHSTLVDTALCVYGRFLRPLSREDAERYYQESTVVAEAFGVPRAHQPADLAEFDEYVRTMVATVEVTDSARRVASSVLHPRLPALVEPVLSPGLVLARQLTAGLLPSRLRDAYGLSWDWPRDVALTATGLTSRLVLRWVPASLRRVPLRMPPLPLARS